MGGDAGPPERTGGALSVTKGAGIGGELAAFEVTGALPDHWADQEPLYDGLLYASARPGFGMGDVDRYYKDATFGVKPGDVASTETPRPGVTIVRDKSYGVPHVYGATA